jgi:hypothetical protein
VFLVTLIPRAFSHALCSACALVNAAVFGGPTGFPFGVDILITRDIRLAPVRCAGKLYQFPGRMSCSTVAKTLLWAGLNDEIFRKRLIIA